MRCTTRSRTSYRTSIPDETQEWIEALDQLIEHSPARARYLLHHSSCTLARARSVCPRWSRPTTSTRSLRNKQPYFPGDEALEGRIRRIIRWNAAVMVSRANKKEDGIGGHLSTYASAASLYEVGFNHFFRGKDAMGGGDQVYIQGHAAPGIYARAFLEGRLDQEHLDYFRSEAFGKGLSSYPHPRLMPEFWEFPTVSMGLSPLLRRLPGAVQPLPAPPRNKGHPRSARVGVHGRRRDGRARVDGRAVDSGARGSRQPHLRRELQPAAARRPGSR